MKRSVLSVLLAVGLLALSAVPAMATPEIVTPMPISIQVDGGWVPTDTAPTVINGRTLIPVRAAGEAIGATMDWDQASRTVTAEMDGLTVQFRIGSNYYTVNGYTYVTDVAPTTKGWRTMLPIRAFSEAFGVGVEWNGELRNVNIDTPAPDAAPPVYPNGGSMEFGTLLMKYYVQQDPLKPLNGMYMGARFLANGNWEHSVIAVSQADDGAVRTAVIDDKWYGDGRDCFNDLELYIDDGNTFYWNPMMDGFKVTVGPQHEFLMGAWNSQWNKMTRHYTWQGDVLIHTHSTNFNGIPWVDNDNFQLERIAQQ